MMRVRKYHVRTTGRYVAGERVGDSYHVESTPYLSIAACHNKRTAQRICRLLNADNAKRRNR